MCRPAKIAPLKPPKEIHNNSTPRCAMQAKLLDHQMLELGESQEGLTVVSNVYKRGRAACRWRGYAQVFPLGVQLGELISSRAIGPSVFHVIA